MQLFYAPDINFDLPTYTFSEDESKHCVRVLRLITGDELHITNGLGVMCRATITDASHRKCVIKLCEIVPEFEKRPYTLHMAVAPTKNIERFEWFVEKATEFGVDRITPLLCDHSERKIVKRDRIEKVATSAMKQSLKAYHPIVDEITPLRKLISEPFEGEKFIAHCEDGGPRVLLKDCIYPGRDALVLIGPEGDFSPSEIKLALANGFKPISLGNSRLRTETAAIAAVHTIEIINE